ncbi:MAG: SGNH/GDSL hydrolase family protein [Candidatus Marinimicrobia bacterium]|nr:SGNH/GDSL hydrolase family protein [Candidatus Neomarinimicrobiota bacterium]
MTMNHLNQRLTTVLFLTVFSMLLLGSCGLKPLAAPKEIIVDPLRFTEVVDGYKAADKIKKPRTNSVLFVGSSSIHGWKTLADDFPELNVINRGMGGSHMSDLNYYLNDLVFPYHPNAVVIYEGDNDIASGKTPDKVLADYKTFVTTIGTKWPELPLFFISIKPSLARIQHLENMAKANALIKAHTEQQENLFYIDVFTPMLGADGTPRSEIFGEDGLHMNEAGYALWTQEIKQELGLE